MTTIYMIRSIASDLLLHPEDAIQKKVKKEQDMICSFFEDRTIDAIYASIHKDAAHTVAQLTRKTNIPTYSSDAFNERNIGAKVANVLSFTRRQWMEPEYKLKDGDSFTDVQNRMLDAMEQVLANHEDETCVICTHPMAMGTVVQYFDDTFTFEEFLGTATQQPWILKFVFEGLTLREIEEIRCLSR